jgi:hypothetical protein
MSSMVSIGMAAFSLSLICLSLADGAPQVDVKTLAKDVKSDIRKVENMTDNSADNQSRRLPGIPYSGGFLSSSLSISFRMTSARVAFVM